MIATTLQDLQQAVRTGNYYVARQCFLELLVEPDAPLPQVYCEMSLGEYQQGNLRTALTFAEAGEKLLVNQPTPDPALLARLRNNLVNFYREIGDVPRSISVGLNWLDEVGDDPTAVFPRGLILYNLALAFRQRGGPHDNAEAFQYYDRARIHFQNMRLSSTRDQERDRYRVFEVMSLQNEAWLRCEMGELDEAEEYARLAAKLLGDNTGAQVREQVLLMAYLAYSRHNLADCQSLLKDLEMHGDAASPRQQFWAEWLAARVSLLTGQRMLTEVHSSLAAAEAERSKEVYLMRLAAELEKAARAAG